MPSPRARPQPPALSCRHAIESVAMWAMVRPSRSSIVTVKPITIRHRAVTAPAKIRDVSAAGYSGVRVLIVWGPPWGPNPVKRPT